MNKPVFQVIFFSLIPKGCQDLLDVDMIKIFTFGHPIIWSIPWILKKGKKNYHQFEFWLTTPCFHLFSYLAMVLSVIRYGSAGFRNYINIIFFWKVGFKKTFCTITSFTRESRVSLHAEWKWQNVIQFRALVEQQMRHDNKKLFKIFLNFNLVLYQPPIANFIFIS